MVPPSFLAGAVITLAFLVVFSVLIKLFFSIDKLLEVWIGAQCRFMNARVIPKPKKESKSVLVRQRNDELVAFSARLPVKS